jgi:hypothetical protein
MMQAADMMEGAITPVAKGRAGRRPWCLVIIVLVRHPFVKAREVI